MIEIGAPIVFALGPGIAAIGAVFAIFATAGMYALGRHDGRRAQDRDTARHILPLLGDKSIVDLIVNDPSPSLLNLLEQEIIRREKT